MLMVKVIPEVGVGTMYRRCLKPCKGRLQEVHSKGLFYSCQSMLRGMSATLVAETFTPQSRLIPGFAKSAPNVIPVGASIWMPRGLWRLSLCQKRVLTSDSPHLWRSCQDLKFTPNMSPAALLLRQHRVPPGHAFRTFVTTAAGASNRRPRKSLTSQKEGLLRMSGSFARYISDEVDADGKIPVNTPSSVEIGGDSDKGAEHTLACDSGGEEDGSNEGQTRRHLASSYVSQDETVREKERKHQGDQDIVFGAQKARFKKAFEHQVLKWENLKVSMDGFPHYLSETTRDLLVECAAAHLRQPKYAEFGAGLPSSSRRICLRGPAGTHLHQERLVEALAHRLRASLLLLNSHTLAPYDFGAHELYTASSSDGSDSEANESSSAFRDEEKEEPHAANMGRDHEFKVDVLLEMAPDTVEDQRQDLLKDRVVQGAGREGQQARPAAWEVKKVSDVIDESPHPADAAEEWVAAIDALCEMSSPASPLVVYFPDPRKWFERAIALERRQEFLERVEAKLDQIEGPIVFIASRTSEDDAALDDRVRLKAHLEDIRNRLNQRTSTRWIFRELLGSEDIYELFVNHIKIYPPKKDEMLRKWKKQLLHDMEISNAKQSLQQLHEILEFNNMDCEELAALDLLGLKLTKTSKTAEHSISIMRCSLLSISRATGCEAEKVVGWARNNHLGLCLSDPPISNGKLMIPRDSMERALTRLRDQENKKAPSIIKDFKTVAEDEYEKALISAVIPPNEVGVKFDHIGALENVKNALKELVMLPLQRPELFSKGNLTRPCKGVLLFGPPGTGKTLLAKAVATEAGANFINITGSTITSKWFGDAEKLTKSLFSLAKKLSPAVIFVDEVDSLLGARGGSSEHEATRKTRNEFMAAWDGLRSKDSERVLVLAATNRPFDLDDAVIRRLPRRILVDLPSTENRVKIFRVILAEEELEEGFDYEELSRITDGYSGSDLKNLSIAAAYRPIRELLQYEEQQTNLGGSNSSNSRARSASLIRPLRLDDFKQAMTQVGASVAFDASSMNELRRWNEQYGEGGNRRKSNFGFVV